MMCWQTPCLEGPRQMLTKYIDAAMRHARYDILKDDGGFYGEIPRCRGVYACGATLEQCRSALAEVLEDWIFFRIHKHLPFASAMPQ